MQETLAPCMFLQQSPTSASPQPQSLPSFPLLPSLLQDALSAPMTSSTPNPPWLLRGFSTSPEHRTLLQGQHRVLWEMAQGAVEDTEMILISESLKYKALC